MACRAQTGAQEEEPDMKDLSVLMVHLDDPDTGTVSFKAKGIKEARWHKAHSIYEAARLADELVPCPRIIEYVERKS